MRLKTQDDESYETIWMQKMLEQQKWLIADKSEHASMGQQFYVWTVGLRPIVKWNLSPVQIRSRNIFTL